MALFSFFHDLLYQVTLKLTWGPSADPNKLAPPMAQYEPAPEWPRWCSGTSHGSNLIKVAFLDVLPQFIQGRHDTSIFDQINNIHLQSLSHYKSSNTWKHEFVRADFIDKRSKKQLIMVWERDLPLTGPKNGKQRILELKSGSSCESVDRVTYIKETDFAKFLNDMQADILRYVP